MHRKEIYAASIIFTLVTIIFIHPIFKNISYWGQMDWDQLMFWNAVPRETILRYHQFPLWNPYSNGGNVMLALPLSFFLTPLFIPILIFGPVIGLKIQWCISLFLGMYGMFFLCNHFKMKRISQYLAPIIFMLSSTFSLHLTEGHPWCGIAFLPWTFLFILKAGESKKCLFLAVLFFAFMILSSTVYIWAMIGLLIYFSLLSFKERSVKHLYSLIFTLSFAFLVCSVKLIPALSFLKENPRKIESSEKIDIPLLSKMLLSRDQEFNYQNTKWTGPGNKIYFMDRELDYGWHEYGAYVGLVSLVLALIGCFYYFKQHWGLIVTGLISLWISLGEGAFLNLWGLLHTLPVYDSMHVPSRLIFVFVFCLSLLAGFGLSQIESVSDTRHYSIFIGLIVFFVFCDLFLVDYPLLTRTFTIEPPIVKRNVEFKQRYRNFNLFTSKSRSSMFLSFLSNSGLINSYDVVYVKRGDVRIASEINYNGEVFLLYNNGHINKTNFTPNKIQVDLDVHKEDKLILNQNYHLGWKVRGTEERVEPHNGLISVKVPSGKYKVTFYYLPNSFIIGSALTVFSLFVFLCIYVKLQD